MGDIYKYIYIYIFLQLSSYEMILAEKILKIGSDTDKATPSSLLLH